MKFIQVISWSLHAWMVWIKSFNGELVREVDTQSRYLKLKVKCTPLKVRMLGTGRRRTFRETSGVSGSNTRRTLASTLPCCLLDRIFAQSSITRRRMNGSKLLRTSPMATTISSSVSSIPSIRTSLLLSTLTSSTLSSPLLRDLRHPSRQVWSVKLSIRDSTPRTWTWRKRRKSCINVIWPLLRFSLSLNKIPGCTLMALRWCALHLSQLFGRLVDSTMESIIFK